MTASSPSIERRPAVSDSPKYVGRYEVLGELASGGTGTVYLARLNGLGGFERLYAIKVLHKHLSTRPEIVEMLLTEAHLAGQIHHPHVVDMVEVSVTEDGRHYLVMGYVEGASLDDLFAHPTLDAIRRVRLGIAFLLDAMSGLDAVHRATDAITGEPLGIVHRDLSPANILIGMDGIGRLADFGIASARARSSLSEPGVVRGTPRYMAPEQATGQGAVDARSDVFALGCVLWEVITGEPLFDSSTSVEHILQQVVGATIPPPSDRNSRMPETVDAVCLRALQRDPAERYATVAEFRDALAQVADANGLIAPPRELVEELSTLFADRVEQRRALARQAARRTSGTQLRAVVVTDANAATEDDSDEPTLPALADIGVQRDSSTRTSITHTQVGIRPLRDAAVDAMARDGISRSRITSTRIGLEAPRPAGEIDIRATLDDLLGHDEEDDDKVEIARARVGRKRGRRWAALALILLLSTGGWLGYRALDRRQSAPAAAIVAAPLPKRAPKPPAPVAALPPAPLEVSALPAAPAAVASAVTGDVPVTTPVVAPQPTALKPKAPLKRPLVRAPVRPRPVAPVDPVEAASIEGGLFEAEGAQPGSEPSNTLPLETNPYRLRR